MAGRFHAFSRTGQAERTNIEQHADIPKPAPEALDLTAGRSLFPAARQVSLTLRQAGRTMKLSFRDERRGALRRRWAAWDDAGNRISTWNGHCDAKREVKE